MKAKKRKIVPKDHTRSLEVIMQENPDMTALKILEEQKYDKECFALWEKNINKKLHDTVDWLNKNKYIKIEYLTGGSGLITYLEITKAYLDKRIYFDAFKSTVSNRRVVNEPNGINVETLHKSTYQQWDNYSTGHSDMEKVTVLTKKQYNNFLNAVKNIYNL